MKKAIYAIFAFIALTTTFGASAARPTLGKPDLEAIRLATTDETSDYYYPKLLKSFMANDTLMSPAEFQYLYYGTLFLEDYDPYRPAADAERQTALAPLFNKPQWSRSERKQILDHAMAILANNPLNLRQLTNRIYVYEQNGKMDLARIWQYKLNHLLLVIASSGSGLDPDNAWFVVYPHDEYDFLNLSGITIREQEFREPYYDYVLINKKDDKQPDGYYFNIEEILRQYYIKHPSEAEQQ